ncbi:hypothetical protein HKX48_002190 [Thoreauomyces humboldtii]|nr:hypothetical protein HKX48_002190 [Thoreauomyces humboldtii]
MSSKSIGTQGSTTTFLALPDHRIPWTLVRSSKLIWYSEHQFKTGTTKLKFNGTVVCIKGVPPGQERETGNKFLAQISEELTEIENHGRRMAEAPQAVAMAEACGGGGRGA